METAERRGLDGLLVRSVSRLERKWRIRLMNDIERIGSWALMRCKQPDF